MSSCNHTRGIDWPSLVNKVKLSQVLRSYQEWNRVEQLSFSLQKTLRWFSEESHTTVTHSQYRQKVSMRDAICHGLHDRLQSVKPRQWMQSYFWLLIEAFPDYLWPTGSSITLKIAELCLFQLALCQDCHLLLQLSKWPHICLSWL